MQVNANCAFISPFHSKCSKHGRDNFLYETYKKMGGAHWT